MRNGTLAKDVCSYHNFGSHLVSVAGFSSHNHMTILSGILHQGVEDGKKVPRAGNKQKYFPHSTPGFHSSEHCQGDTLECGHRQPMREFLLLELRNSHHPAAGLGTGLSQLVLLVGIPPPRMLELLGGDETLRDTEMLSLKHATLSQAICCKKEETPKSSSSRRRGC